ncbi:MAG: hypothetical protein AAF603_01570 [Pseudomonadota bacterium]
MHNMITIGACCALLASFTGCASYADIDGPFYGQGFSDGCRTAQARQASFSTDTFRDEVLFKEEASYRSGWRGGYAQCDRMDDIDNRPGDLGERDPI